MPKWHNNLEFYLLLSFLPFFSLDAYWFRFDGERFLESLQEERGAGG